MYLKKKLLLQCAPRLDSTLFSFLWTQKTREPLTFSFAPDRDLNHHMTTKTPFGSWIFKNCKCCFKGFYMNVSNFGWIFYYIVLKKVFYGEAPHSHSFASKKRKYLHSKCLTRGRFEKKKDPRPERRIKIRKQVTFSSCAVPKGCTF